MSYQPIHDIIIIVQIIKKKTVVIIITQTVTQAVSDVTTEVTQQTTVTDQNVVYAFTEEAEKTVSLFSKLTDAVKGRIPSIIVALIVFILGIVISKLILKAIEKSEKRANIDKTAHSFIKSFIGTILYALSVLIALNTLGVPMASIITVIGAAGLALGLALQQCLSNVAGGFIILFSKPFKVGEYISINGQEGTVESISILYTTISTLDNRIINIPNGTITGSSIENRTVRPIRRLDMKLPVSYDADIKLTKSVISEVIKNEPFALDIPEPFIYLSDFADSAIMIEIRVWTKTENYPLVKYELNEKIKEAFDSNNISIPYNQLDVHISGSGEKTGG